jgi:nucleoside-diphosphate-sugar epimerase
MRRILITGAQGLLGRNLVRTWTASEEPVRIVCLRQSPRLDCHFKHDLL